MKERRDKERADPVRTAAEWCLRLVENDMTISDRREFDRWCEDSSNAQALEEAMTTWYALDDLTEHRQIAELRDGAVERHRYRKYQGRAQRLIRPVAWLVSGGLVAFAAQLLIAGFLLQHQPKTYETGLAERRVAVLSDGSSVSLDASTKVIAEIHGKERELKLERGRARFDVVSDPLRPFTVAAGNKLVVATGTSFSVEVLSSDIRVLLYEGSVTVLDRPATTKSNKPALAESRKHLTQLAPGQQLILPTVGESILEPADLSKSMAWEAGQVSFANEPLVVAVERLNRYTSSRLEIGDEALQEIHVSGVFSTRDTAAFIEGLTTLYDVRVEKHGDRIVLKER
ncbi:FecR family protein [Woeseia oceani]|uniref:FecR protein domain-containing protein n=1 Tax=Woeseia oceani TaxID=1548547 RepID=A0A193LCF0_9GAMM|nr:FecR domain-containing protein [Woeseia oceani]ANO50111.1 hypothetical protein BA177_01755 [Woeseia oceani]